MVSKSGQLLWLVWKVLNRNQKSLAWRRKLPKKQLENHLWKKGVENPEEERRWIHHRRGK